MKLTILKKMPGSKQVLASKEVELPEAVSTLRDLLKALVDQEVAEYNRRLEQQPQPLEEWVLISMLSEGRVTFGGAEGVKKQPPERAKAVAIQTFEDGLFRVVLNGETITDLDVPLSLQEGSTLIFIKLTFLAGGF